MIPQEITQDQVELVCQGCGNTFVMAKELFDRVTKKRSDYCSYACFEKYVVTPDTARRIRSRS
jgi:hypothetical protein